MGTQSKDAARAALEAAPHVLIRRLQAGPDVDDAERAALRITVPDRSPSAVPAPIPRPVVRIDASPRVRHRIAFADETTSTSTRKPAGVPAVEIWGEVGSPPPVDVSQMAFLAAHTRSPYLATYEGADGGKPAHDLLRWINTKGQPGPWSDTATATIGA